MIPKIIQPQRYKFSFKRLNNFLFFFILTSFFFILYSLFFVLYYLFFILYSLA